MLTEERRNELLDLLETEDPRGSGEWRNHLAPEEADYVAHWDQVQNEIDEFCEESEVNIELTEELMGKIGRFADREGKVVASKFNRFAAAVQKAKFSPKNPKSYYEARDYISHLAEKYGLSWMKLDSDHVSWQYEKFFKIDKDLYVGFAVGYDIDYYGKEPEDLWDILSSFVVENFGSMTQVEAAYLIENYLITSINEGNYFPM